MALLSPDGSRIGDTGGVLPAAALRPFQELVARASAADEARAQAFAHLPPDGADGKLYALLVVPIYAPGARGRRVDRARPADRPRVRDGPEGGRAP